MQVEELKRTFEDFGPIEVQEERGRFVVHVVSPRFEGMEDAERQVQVWERAHQRLGLRASVDIEFIFTYSPTEWDRLNRGEELEELQE